jgi:SAM-dependent methyltransferase
MTTRAAPVLRQTGERAVPPFPADRAPRLAIDERTIRRVARERTRPIAVIVIKQAYTEARVRFAKKLPFRKTPNAQAREAYRSMRVDDFVGVNARQSWANWRTIPRSLDGRLPDRPVDAIDLCCGIGESTEVLAYYVAPGSRLLGLEYSPDFVQIARRRAYVDRTGASAAVRFSAQSVLETFREPDGAEVRSASVDLVNASGAIGCHFDRPSTEVLAHEVARVLRPGGMATIDSGKQGTTRDDLLEIFGALGFTLVHSARSCALDRYRQLCLVKQA